MLVFESCAQSFKGLDLAVQTEFAIVCASVSHGPNCSGPRENPELFDVFPD
jgi:hypothetical protein